MKETTLTSLIFGIVILILLLVMAGTFGLMGSYLYIQEQIHLCEDLNEAGLIATLEGSYWKAGIYCYVYLDNGYKIKAEHINLENELILLRRN